MTKIHPIVAQISISIRHGISVAESMRCNILPLVAGMSGRLYVGSGFEHKNITDRPKETSA